MLCYRLHSAHFRQRNCSPQFSTSFPVTVRIHSPGSLLTLTLNSLQIPPASHRHFSSLARRLGRIFAHAYFHHRDIFAQAEAESSLYARFLALTMRYDLVPPDFIVIPPTKVITTDGEGEEIDIPRNANDRQGEPKTSVMVPDPSEVQPPRLLAASLDPQAEREKDKIGTGAQRRQPTRKLFLSLFIE